VLLPSRTVQLTESCTDRLYPEAFIGRVYMEVHKNVGPFILILEDKMRKVQGQRLNPTSHSKKRPKPICGFQKRLKQTPYTVLPCILMLPQSSSTTDIPTYFLLHSNYIVALFLPTLSLFPSSPSLYSIPITHLIFTTAT